MEERNYQNHVTILAWVNIGFSALVLCMGILGMLVLTGMGIVSGEAGAFGLFTFLGTGAAVFFGALALPGFAAGYGLLKRHAWGRVLAIIVGVFNVFNAPVGTVVGLYALWVLTHQHAAGYFDPAPPAPQPSTGQTPI